MQEISRRAVLAGAAIVPIALGLPGSAAAANSAARAKPAQQEPFGPGACGELGSTRVCVTAQEVLNVTGLEYTLTNGGNTPASYTLSYVDLAGGPEGRPRTVSLEAGESVIDYFYGDLQHCFTLRVCKTGGDCLTLGPVCAESL